MVEGALEEVVGVLEGVLEESCWREGWCEREGWEEGVDGVGVLVERLGAIVEGGVWGGGGGRARVCRVVGVERRRWWV